jgi:hypothetical protein
MVVEAGRYDFLDAEICGDVLAETPVVSLRVPRGSADGPPGASRRKTLT